jgi:hypothetical protein
MFDEQPTWQVLGLGRGLAHPVALVLAATLWGPHFQLQF